MQSIREVLRGAFRDAMKAREREAVSTLRIALGAIDNAEAVDVSAAPANEGGYIAGGVAGLGAGEVPRVELTEAQMRAIVVAEADQLDDERAAILRALVASDP